MARRGLYDKAEIAALPESGRVVVGFSGGADSAALAHFISKKVSPERVILAHVNHQLRGQEADRDEAAAEEFSRQLGLRFAVLRRDVRALAEEKGLGLEECGRQVRYEFFSSLAPEENDRILTAHNLNDNAETVLLNLSRGASLKGLCGIPYSRGKILRPLLNVSRAEIEEYCRENDIPFVMDSSNLCDDYDRNKVRHAVLPVLEEINPRFLDSVAQMTELLKIDGEYLELQAESLLKDAEIPNGLDAKKLKNIHPAILSRVLKLYLEKSGCGRLEKKHIDEAARILKEGGAATLPNELTVCCSQGVFTAVKQTEFEEFSIPLREGENSLPTGKTVILRKKTTINCGEKPKIHNLLFKNAIDCDIIRDTLTARSRREGDTFPPAGRKLTKSLKQIFMENRVPSPLRSRMVLIESGGRLVFCEGAGVAEGFQISESTKEVFIIEIRETGEENKNEGK